jgi:RHH-type proline utilization regulon transcriptional repressor/proline dehydrogenase/delta 1-pyrroline-5-carboxylate dehydrogenase
MNFCEPKYERDALRKAINVAYRMDETQCVSDLLLQAQLPAQTMQAIAQQAEQLVAGIRKRRKQEGGLDAFLAEYDLSSMEGIALMCLAEALRRVPDKTNMDKLIRDKLRQGQWENHQGQSDSIFVNAMTWGLVLTGKLVTSDQPLEKSLGATLKKLVARSGMPAVRMAVNQMMKIMSQQFVMGQSIEDALKRAREAEKKGYRYSYDMLGEAAYTEHDAKRYFLAYQQAIQAIGKQAKQVNCLANPGISVKLSALHPRYQYAQRARVIQELIPQVLKLAQLAKAANIHFTIDAEEADRLELSLDVIEAVFTDSSLSGWEGFGLAVQAYQKRAVPLIDWLAALAKSQQRRIMVRLIKGAYWDSEIKWAQVLGQAGYPVFTRKAATDVCYLACVKKLFSLHENFYLAFGTHNAYTVAAVKAMAPANVAYEFQCIHGMGYPLYDQIIDATAEGAACRIYAPVGGYIDLLPYLMRRLLENGANTSFIHLIANETLPVAQLVESPTVKLASMKHKPHPTIPLPRDLYGIARKNAKGIDLTDHEALQTLASALTLALQQQYRALPLVGSTLKHEESCVQSIVDPADTRRIVGSVVEANAQHVEIALQRASAAHTRWCVTPVVERAACLEKMAELLEDNMAQFMLLAIREAGKTLPDALAEVREAIDFCRYYALEGKRLFGAPQVLPGPTGETNTLSMVGRGVVACISPWNFPLAIFLGQVSAALVAGNSVIAKPAEQTPLIASLAVQLFHQAGVPDDVLQLLPGKGEVVGQQLVTDNRVKAVIFTGSTETARHINQALAARSGEFVPLIAETGGQNAMLVDSTALPEQVTRDVLESAFKSAGQRCSALRVLFLQEEIADKMLEMLQGAMAELRMGDPGLLATDIGPVIDSEARAMLQQHFDHLSKTAKLLYQVPLPEACQQGHFFAPCMFEIESISQLKREVFGPILHVCRYKMAELDQVLAAINQTGYGLTFGIHSRIDDTVAYVRERIHAGNIYVNRNMIGAVVGVQPFGGEGLSGTGPKAGGPNYLLRLVHERTVTVDTTAAGGNASLLAMQDAQD